MLHSVGLLSEKKRSATWAFLTKFAYFNKISRTFYIYTDVNKNLMTSLEIYCHHSNPIVLKIPCAKLYTSSCSETKVKIRLATLPPINQSKVQKEHMEWG